MDDKLKQALYEEAQTNGFNSTEYGLLLTAVDNLLNDMTLHTQEYLKGTTPDDYDINGKPAEEK